MLFIEPNPVVPKIGADYGSKGRASASSEPAAARASEVRMSQAYPISIKGVILVTDAVVLLENERGEWELPGGRLEPGETPETCLEREVAEELGLAAESGPILAAELFEVIPGRSVFVVSYIAIPSGDTQALRVSAEHRRARLVGLAELGHIDLPGCYRRAIVRAVDIRDRIARK
jgi:8-oxo-dGTP pyrophosphatase MutT (NUDIX family)